MAEVVIVGGGIAGAALAYFLSQRGLGGVTLLEREPQPGQHATGRSAAVLVELDPNLTLQRLKIASAPFLRAPPDGFAEHPVLVRSGILLLFREPTWSFVRAAAPQFERAGARLELLAPEAAARRVPVLAPAEIDGAIALPEDGHLDVHGLLLAYLGHARRRGVDVRCGVEVVGLRAASGRCTGVETSAGAIEARWVVNAAGAWAGQVARLFGAAPIEMVPRRRCIAVFAASRELQAAGLSGWPLVASDEHRVYFAPESGGFLVSPMDEVATEPCDARPDDQAIAEALERLAVLAPGLAPRTLRRKWAGLRTFAPDGVPVVGEDPLLPGFFWLAGQGGCGIETSPILGQVAADLIVNGRTERFDARVLAPARFAQLAQ